MYHVMLNRSNIRTSLCETSSRHGQAEGGGGEGHREEVDEKDVGGLMGKTPTHLSYLLIFVELRSWCSSNSDLDFYLGVSAGVSGNDF